MLHLISPASVPGQRPRIHSLQRIVFAPLALPITFWVTNSKKERKKPDTFHHCPHSFPLSLPAIQSLTCVLRGYDLCLFLFTVLPHCTQTNCHAIRLHPLKLLLKYDKAWAHLTSYTSTELLYSVQFHFLKNQPSPPPASTPPLSNPHGSPPIEDTKCQVG